MLLVASTFVRKYEEVDVCVQTKFPGNAGDLSERMCFNCTRKEPVQTPFVPLLLPLLGHGDQRHAVHRDRVCKERRDVWWVQSPA